jgi:hypothetical protein
MRVKNKKTKLHFSPLRFKMLRFWSLLKKMAKVAPFFGTRDVFLAILGQKGPNFHFLNRGPKSQHFKTYGAKSAI